SSTWTAIRTFRRSIKAGLKFRARRCRKERTTTRRSLRWCWSGAAKNCKGKRMDVEIIAEGLQFPEGPIIMPDGSVILVEIRRGTLSRAWNGKIEVIAD